MSIFKFELDLSFMMLYILFNLKENVSSLQKLLFGNNKLTKSKKAP